MKADTQRALDTLAANGLWLDVGYGHIEGHRICKKSPCWRVTVTNTKTGENFSSLYSTDSYDACVTFALLQCRHVKKWVK